MEIIEELFTKNLHQETLESPYEAVFQTTTVNESLLKVKKSKVGGLGFVCAYHGGRGEGWGPDKAGLRCPGDGPRS